ncbi:hypothetical protein GLOIN_2v1767361 [Rhizophagus clarus]|uniref:Uncharacterized protein n=1 Tax=Rhizophagus clarus TaxID=94130 RepID=A0A8H3QBP7_9GLOM|nr:hypothetical protein GLOIN_2v1767361 [Rhizophagus clarus]
MAEMCMVNGNSDIIGPGVRISVYVQGFLAIFKILAEGDEIIESTNLGAFTTFALIVSTLISKDVDYVMLLEVSQLVSVLLISYFSVPILLLKTGGVKNSKKYIACILVLIAYTLSVCHDIWLWVKIKWGLPKECDNVVKYYLLCIPINPVGHLRTFLIVMNAISLPSILIIISVIYKERKDNSGSKRMNEYGSECKCECQCECVKESVIVKESESESSKLGEKITCAFFMMIFLPTLIITITSAELSIQRNSILGIWDWGYGQIVAMVLAAGDTLNTTAGLFAFYINEIKEAKEAKEAKGVKAVLHGQVIRTGKAIAALVLFSVPTLLIAIAVIVVIAVVGGVVALVVFFLDH